MVNGLWKLMINKNVLKHRFLLLSLSCAIFIACEDSSQKTIFPKECECQEGDIVFRRGTSIESNAVLYADGGLYSHVGIVVDYQGKRMIVHSVPGEQEHKDDEDKIKMDSIEGFFSHERAVVGAVCRPIDTLICKQSAEYAIELFKKGVLFDHDYDFSDTSKLYCTELLSFIYKKCGRKLVESDGHDVDFPLIKHKVILPSDIFNSKQLKLIRKF
jgi:hypothetical protein